MIFVRYVQETGMLYGKCDVPDTQVACQQGDNILWVDADPNTQYLDVQTGALRPIPPQPSTAHEWDWKRKLWVFRPTIAARQARQQRDALLSACDWTQLPDVPGQTKAAWAVYRQALRDISIQPGFPERVTWPTPPA